MTRLPSTCSTFILLFILTFETSAAWSNKKLERSLNENVGSATRRQALFTALFIPASPALAFDNKISTKYDDRPKRRGPKPNDLGVSSKRMDFEGETYTGLKSCGPAPNCFSSTIPDDPDHSIPPFVWPSQLDQPAAMEELLQVLKAYEPGQNGVDGGGFAIQAVKPDYILVVFESLKNGFYDDVEFAVIPGTKERSVQVRSSSRIGYLDFGVNGKRLNFIAKALRDKGWEAEGVDYKTHPLYVEENRL